MSEEILSKEPIAIPMLNGFLKEAKKEDRAKVQDEIADYAKKTSKLTEASCTKLVAELKELNIPGMTPELIVSLANIAPITMTEIRAVMSGKSNINPENFKRIHEVLVKYAG
jgi:DNA-directed RNA polymerase subunit F